jgi:hypothetical protein
MQRLEVSGAVRHIYIYMSLGVKGLTLALDGYEQSEPSLGLSTAKKSRGTHYAGVSWATEPIWTVRRKADLLLPPVLSAR